MEWVAENPFKVQEAYLEDLEALELDEGLGSDILKKLAPRAHRRMELRKKIGSKITSAQRDKLKQHAHDKLQKHYSKVQARGAKAGG